MNRYAFLFAVALAACTAAAPECKVDTDCASDQICAAEVCRLPVYPETAPFATERATYTLNATNRLVNGRLISPAGEAVLVGTQPSRIVLTPDDKYIVANEATWGSNNNNDLPTTYYLRVIDRVAMKVVTTKAASSGLLWHGLALTVTSVTSVWATDGRGEHLFQFTLDADGGLSETRAYDLPGCYTTDVAVDAAGGVAYVTCLKSSTAALDGKLAFLNLTNGVVEKTIDLGGAFYLLLTPDAKRLFVAAVATEVRPADGDTVWVVDTARRKVVATTQVGLGPEGMVYDAGRKLVYVACNRSDEIFALDAASGAEKAVFPLHDEPAPLKGLHPIGLALSPDGDTLYATLSLENAVAVLDAGDGTVRGMIPTGWYPNDVRVTADGEIIVSNGRGVGDGPADMPGPKLLGPGDGLRGTIAKVEAPDAARLATYTTQVDENNRQQARYFDFSKGNDTPLPSPGAPTAASKQIKHVFFILKENFSYDAAYGDFERGDGEPEYNLWPEAIIPNQRKLAREYTLFDNFYCEADSSLDGHAWAAAGIETDFMEKFNWFADDFGSIAVSLTPGSAGEGPFFMPNLIAQDIAVLAFGGIENFGVEALSTYKDKIVHEFYWNTVPEKTDVGRAEIFKREFANRLKYGNVPAYSWIFLGNNHTFGLKVGEPIPEYWVGENDQAVGTVIGEIAKSPIWDESLILITEDDSQSGRDHVDKHRCAALAVGPWVRRGYTSHVMYTISNFQKTTELLLGSRPMNRVDARAVGMYDIFVARPDATPYEPVVRDVPRTLYEGPQNALTAMSARMDWTHVDRNPDAGDFFWRYRKGTTPPPREVFYRHRADHDDHDD